MGRLFFFLFDSAPAKNRTSNNGLEVRSYIHLTTGAIPILKHLSMLWCLEHSRKFDFSELCFMSSIYYNPVMEFRPKILLLQFRMHAKAADLEKDSIGRELGDSVNLTTHCVLSKTELLLNEVKKFDGVILGGSGDLDFDGGRDDFDTARLQSRLLLDDISPTLDYVFMNDIPTFGICFGHQLLGAFNNVDVHHDKTQHKMKTHEVDLLPGADSYSIIKNIPKTFAAHYGHKDVLDKVPVGATLLASGGDSCKISALAYGKNIFSTQFHPELSLDDLRMRVANIPNYLPEGCCLEDLYKEAREANKFLANFAKLVADYK